MGLRRPGAPKDYEEMAGANVPPTRTQQHRQHQSHDMHDHQQQQQHPSGLSLEQLQQQQQHSNGIMGQEFEMASVSVVPDGKSSAACIWEECKWICG